METKMRFLFVLLIACTTCQEIFLGGLFDINGVTDPNAKDAREAFYYAINVVNANASILPNHLLVPVVGNDDCVRFSAGEFVRVSEEVNNTLLGLVGPFCDDTLNAIYGVQDIYSLPLIMAPSMTNPEFSDAEFFRFGRLSNSFSTVANAWLSIATFYHLDTVGILYSVLDTEIFATANLFASLAKERNITVIAHGFIDTPLSKSNALIFLKENGVTNYFLGSNSEDALMLLETANQEKVLGFGYLWIGSSHWVFDNVTSDQRSILNGIFAVSPITTFPNLDNWLDSFESAQNITNNYDHLAFTYDAVFTIAKALHEVIEIDLVTYNTSTEFKVLIFQKILESKSSGITGQIEFDSNGDRKQLDFQFLNYQDDSFSTVGHIDQLGNLEIITDVITWPGNYSNDGSTIPPIVINFIAEIRSSTWAQLLPVFYLAIEEINSNNSLLPNYYLNPSIINSECSGLIGFKEFIDVFTAFGGIHTFIVGGSCSTVSQPLGQTTPIYKMPMVSYSSTSPILSNRNQYPLFRRTVAPDTYQGIAWYIIIKNFEWNRVATINSNEDIHSLLVKEFTKLAEDDDDVQVLTQEVFPGSTEFNITSQLENIRSRGARIILLACYEPDATIILDAAYDLEMTGENGYVWIGTDSWFNSVLVPKVQDKWQGIIGTNPALGRSEISESFWTKLYSTGYNVSKFVYTETLYDTVYTYAHTLHALLEVEGISYSSDNNFRNLIFEKLADTDFDGVNGRIQFNDNGDRLMQYDLLNLGSSGFVTVATINSQENTYSEEEVIVWGTGSSDTPLDHPQPVTTPLNSVMVVFFYILAILGLILTAFFTGILIYFRENQVFVAARVIFCVIILICGLLAYSSIIVGSFYNDIACWIYPWLVHIPLGLALSSILSKAVRVYVIFVKNRKKLKIVKITDEQLLSYVGVFLAIEIVYMLVFMLINPYVNTTIQDDLDPDAQFEYCELRDTESILYYWPTGLYLLEGVLVIAGVVLGYLTRKVEMLLYNESSFISICIYNLAFTGTVLLPLTLLISLQDRDTHYAIQSAGVLLNITVLLLFFFVSRIHYTSKIEDTDEGTTMTKVRRIK